MEVAPIDDGHGQLIVLAQPSRGIQPGEAAADDHHPMPATWIQRHRLSPLQKPR